MHTVNLGSGNTASWSKRNYVHCFCLMNVFQFSNDCVHLFNQSVINCIVSASRLQYENSATEPVSGLVTCSLLLLGSAR